MTAAQTITDKDGMTARFLRDVARHEMTIVRDDGVARHVRFAIPNNSNMHFDLITWPGCLCYTGDMGTYVFRRDRDMFDFFRRGSHERAYRIDFRYWAEKVEAQDKSGGITEYSKAKFIAAVNDAVDARAREYFDEERTAEDAKVKHGAAYAGLRKAVAKDVLSAADEGEERARLAIEEFSYAGQPWRDFYGENAEDSFTFADTEFWEADLTEYTHRFLWCCHALAWGIEVYDQAKLASAVDTRTLDLFTGPVAQSEAIR